MTKLFTKVNETLGLQFYPKNYRAKTHQFSNSIEKNFSDGRIDRYK